MTTLFVVLSVAFIIWVGLIAAAYLSGRLDWLIDLIGFALVSLFAVAAIAGIAFLVIAPFTEGFIPDYSCGERHGYITKVSTKGWFWKTHECELQVGVGAMASLQEPFSFSVVDVNVLERVVKVAGEETRVRVKYTQWGIQPHWRGGSGYEATDIDYESDLTEQVTRD